VTPESIKNKIVEVAGTPFKVINAGKLNDMEWSLVGFWLDAQGNPLTKHAEHVMCPPEVIVVLP
jgi:hypothetical protein